MSTNRRKFLRNIALGSGALSLGLPAIAHDNSYEEEALIRSYSTAAGKQRFNMSGYAAPKIERVKIGFIGLGNRGSGAVQRIANIQGIEITALCDKHADRVAKSQTALDKKGIK